MGTQQLNGPLQNLDKKESHNSLSTLKPQVILKTFIMGLVHPLFKSGIYLQISNLLDD